MGDGRWEMGDLWGEGRGGGRQREQYQQASDAMEESLAEALSTKDEALANILCLLSSILFSVFQVLWVDRPLSDPLRDCAKELCRGI